MEKMFHVAWASPRIVLARPARTVFYATFRKKASVMTTVILGFICPTKLRVARLFRVGRL